MKKRFLLVLIFFLSIKGFAVEVAQIIQQISEKERLYLTYLFRRLLFMEDFAYCMWGTKPIAIDDGVYSNTELEKFSKTFIFPNFSQETGEKEYYSRGVLAWKKYKHLFPTTKFILLDEEKDLFPNSVAIALINKEEVENTFKEHRALFQSILGDEITAESLIKKMESTSLKKAIGKSEILLGILLGYGKHNALLFNEKKTYFRILNRPVQEHFIYNHAMIKKKFDEIDKKLKCFSEFDESPSLIWPLYFCAENLHWETIRLKEKYQHERKFITEIYYGVDFLETTFKRLMSVK